MHLVSVVLYNESGEQRRVEFRRGLNVITGNKSTGKSALLDIVEYCLGRSTLVTPVGPITQSVVWYGLVVQLDGQRAFIGRPRPKTGAATSQQAMFELGAAVDAPDFDRLVVNSDVATVRDQLGRALGITETVVDATYASSQYEINLGHAALLCFQGQNEIANQDFLFHRQGEAGIAKALQDTIPFFIGAVTADRAVVRQRLLAARRALREAEARLDEARSNDEIVDVRTRAFIDESVTAGLITGEPPAGLAESLTALRSVAVLQLQQSPALDDAEAGERERLTRRRSDLRAELFQVGRDRSLLENLDADEREFEGVVAQQTSRLRSLDLLGDAADHGSDSCPVCGSGLTEPDPTVADMREAARQLELQAGEFGIARPKRQSALAAFDGRAQAIRDEIRTIESQVEALDASRRATETGRSFAERQAFLQGRIQQFLETASEPDSGRVAELTIRVATRQAAVDELAALLDPDEEREQLMSRLALIGRDMLRLADRLALEHSGVLVRLDVKRLTVVSDTSEGPAPLNRIGSGANWIGYHLVAHLALHKYFLEHNRPVPSFLMLDQITQAYYPSDVHDASELPSTDDDRQAVQALFELIHDVVTELDDELQVIVCDHANLAIDWFQDSVIENLRGGKKLIDPAWLVEATS